MKAPREFYIHLGGNGRNIGVDSPDYDFQDSVYELGEDRPGRPDFKKQNYIRVIERSAYDAVLKELNRYKAQPKSGPYQPESSLGYFVEDELPFGDTSGTTQ